MRRENRSELLALIKHRGRFLPAGLWMNDSVRGMGGDTKYSLVLNICQRSRLEAN